MYIVKKTRYTAAFTLHTDPNFPNCTLYGRYEVTTTDSHPTNSKPTGKYYAVIMAVSIPTGFVVIATATSYGHSACMLGLLPTVFGEAIRSEEVRPS